MGSIFWRLAALVLLGFVAGYIARPWLAVPEAKPRLVQPRGDLAADEKATIELFRQVSPSVVYISTRMRVVDPWTRLVFERPKGTGSGFIWDAEGHVVTNFHVIEGASRAIVRLVDGRAYPAVLVGASPEHDLAVLAINVPFHPPPPIPLGSSAELQVGQKVFAIGNPFGLDHTLTTGIVSALDRSIRGENGLIEHLIQTDAAINPGNSGGPLLDSAGRLIGVNTAIYSPSGAYAGIGFAIPSDTVNEVVPELIAHGRLVRPWLGVSGDDRISRLVLDELGIEGVLVLKVEPGSPAEAAGLRPTRIGPGGAIVAGDVIVSVDGKPVRSFEELAKTVRRHRPGDRVRLGIWRAGERLALEVRLAGAHRGS